MKIAILTQPLKSNYGCILQAYALQTVLTNLNHKVEVVNRDYAKPTIKVRFKRILRFFHTLFFKFFLGRKYLIVSNPLKQDYEYLPKSKVHAFIERYINQGQRIQSSELLKKYFTEQQFDAYIVGSDQVWRPNYSPCITNYYLDEVPAGALAKRIAYAASFGTTEWEYTQAQTEVCSRLVKLFTAVSVREDSGVILCNKYLGVEAQNVLDPTLLLQEADYVRLIESATVKSIGEAYMACYILDESVEKNTLIKEISNEIKVDPVYLNDNVSNNTYYSLSVEEWLDRYRNANFVVVDSFHGCVFSIIFRKPFIVYGNKMRGMSRFESLLGQLGLSTRLISSLEDFYRHKDELLAPIDYDEVYAILGERREDSFTFLWDALM